MSKAKALNINTGREPHSSFCLEVDTVLTLIGDMLKEKNLRYGNSALEPLRVFSRASTDEQLRVRIDDKLSRIKAGTLNDPEEVEADLIGYLVLKLIHNRRRDTTEE